MMQEDLKSLIELAYVVPVPAVAQCRFKLWRKAQVSKFLHCSFHQFGVFVEGDFSAASASQIVIIGEKVRLCPAECFRRTSGEENNSTSRVLLEPTETDFLDH